jgi:hypothetical protein
MPITPCHRIVQRGSPVCSRRLAERYRVGKSEGEATAIELLLTFPPICRLFMDGGRVTQHPEIDARRWRISGALPLAGDEVLIRATPRMSACGFRWRAISVLNFGRFAIPERVRVLDGVTDSLCDSSSNLSITRN